MSNNTKLEEVTKQVQELVERLTHLKDSVNKLYYDSLERDDFEIPFNTFMYKIDWLKDQLKTDYGDWIADCDLIRIERLKENMK